MNKIDRLIALTGVLARGVQSILAEEADLSLGQGRIGMETYLLFHHCKEYLNSVLEDTEVLEVSAADVVDILIKGADFDLLDEKDGDELHPEMDMLLDKLIESLLKEEGT